MEMEQARAGVSTRDARRTVPHGRQGDQSPPGASPEAAFSRRNHPSPRCDESSQDRRPHPDIPPRRVSLGNPRACGPFFMPSTGLARGMQMDLPAECDPVTSTGSARRWHREDRPKACRLGCVAAAKWPRFPRQRRVPPTRAGYGDSLGAGRLREGARLPVVSCAVFIHGHGPQRRRSPGFQAFGQVFRVSPLAIVGGPMAGDQSQFPT